jgi:hypothetical protein
MHAETQRRLCGCRERGVLRFLGGAHLLLQRCKLRREQHQGLMTFMPSQQQNQLLPLNHSCLERARVEARTSCNGAANHHHLQQQQHRRHHRLMRENAGCRRGAMERAKCWCHGDKVRWMMMKISGPRKMTGPTMMPYIKRRARMLMPFHLCGIHSERRGTHLHLQLYLYRPLTRCRLSLASKSGSGLMTFNASSPALSLQAAEA